MSRLEIQVASLPTTLDGLVTENFEQWTVVYNIADRLVEYGSKDELQTNLVKGYRVSADGKEYTFELRPDRHFHNGDPVTVEDVIYSLDLSLRNEHSYSRLRDQVACVPGSKEEGCGAITRLSATEFRVKLRDSSRIFLDKLNMNENAIRSKKAALAGHIVYSGPYRVIKIDANAIELQLNEPHPKARSGAFKTIVIDRLPEQAPDILKSLERPDQSTVMISKGFPTLLSKTSRISPAESYQYASGNSYLLAFRSSLPDVDLYKQIIQQALLAPGALDAFPYLKPLSTIYPTGYALATPVLLGKPAATKHLLAPLRIKYVPSSLSPELVKHLTKMFANAGVTLDLVAVDDSTYRAGLDGSNFDGMVAYPFIDIQDDVRVARGYFSGYWNYFPHPRTDLTALLNSADRAPSQDERTAMMREFYQKVVREYPLVPLFFTPNMILLSNDLDRRNLEFYGNTIKFELFKRKQAK